MASTLTIGQILDKCSEELVNGLGIDITFTAQLVSRGVITDENRQLILAQNTQYLKVNELIKILRTKDKKSFNVFRGIVRDHNSDLAELISEPNCDINPGGASSSGATTSSEATDRIWIDDGGLFSLKVKVEPGTREFFDEKITETPYKIIPENSRGRAYIINVQKVKENERKGTDCDRDVLSKLFKKLQFDVHVFNDRNGLKKHEIEKKIENMAKEEDKKKDAQCLVLCILSHGGTETDDKTVLTTKDDQKKRGKRENDKGYFLGTDGGRVYNDFVFTQFSDQNCQALIGKPRLIFYQACRDFTEVQRDEDVQFNDFLVGYPTLKGDSAYRTRAGSFYIQTLVEVFMNNAWKTHVSDMMDMVKEKVIQKQKKVIMIPDKINKLKGTFYFFPNTPPF